MPLFDFTCSNGHISERLLSPIELAVIERTTAETCAICGKPLVRKLSAPASSFPGAASWRKGKG